MLTLNNINSKLRSASYEVRGKLVDKALQLERSGRKIIYCNIGNPQATKQKPLTYPRQVLSLLEYPELLNKKEVYNLYPSDVIETAKFILKNCPNGLGAYTESTGMLFIRKAIAEFIKKRDGIPVDENSIQLTDGASKGIQFVITLLTNTSNDGFMIPIPQYPLYSATINLYGARQIEYYSDEEHNWDLTEEELNRSYKAAKAKGINPVAIVVINPGNPTGSVLSESTIKMVINFAKTHNLTILADEVYQENIYSKDLKFTSFAKVLYEMNDTETTLFSFHSTSKGFIGECGHRGGYMEARNLPQESRMQLTKLQSIALCANSVGQIMTYLMVNHPKEGSPSYELYNKEKNDILNALKTKAEILYNGINNIDGMKAGTVQGAMYAYVKFTLPDEKGVNRAAMTEDEAVAYETRRNLDYCLSLLEETGICVVPGSGFGQIPGTYHFRSTFLPPQNEITMMIEKLEKFNEEYVKKLTSK